MVAFNTATVSGAAATSLLELSQVGRQEEEEEAAADGNATAVATEAGTILVQSDAVVEIPGQEGGYILVTTAEGDSSKLVPISLTTEGTEPTESATEEKHVEESDDDDGTTIVTTDETPKE